MQLFVPIVCYITLHYSLPEMIAAYFTNSVEKWIEMKLEAMSAEAQLYLRHLKNILFVA